LESLERPLVTDTLQMMGPIMEHEAMFPAVWIINNGKEKQRFHINGYKHCTSDSIWIGYNPVKN
jgi:hypothetical protein